MTAPERSRRVAGRTVRVVGAHADARLDEPLYAVNWFDRKRPRVYDLYNTLAAPAVGAVGGRGHFKGRRVRTLEGPRERERDTLLVVSYPGADAFLRMAANPYFQAISPLREAGVKDFVFGFTRRVDDGPAPPKRPRGRARGERALVHHFEAERGALARHAKGLAAAARDAGATLHYAGEVEARLAVRREAPFFIDGIVVTSAPDERALDAFGESLALAALRKETRADVLGVFEREW